jgi:hypothetical protein
MIVQIEQWSNGKVAESEIARARVEEVRNKLPSTFLEKSGIIAAQCNPAAGDNPD